MKNTENLHINFEGVPDGAIIRFGEAAAPINPKSYSVTGNISAVFDYLRVKDVDPKKAVIRFDTSKNEIVLVTEEYNPICTTVTAQLKENPLFSKLGINSDNTSYTPDELAKALNMNQFYFPQTETQNLTSIINNLRNFSAKVEGEISKNDDLRGNKGINIQKRIATESIPRRLTIRAPIFIGGDETHFQVDLLVESLDTKVVIALQSPELEQIKTELAQKHLKTHRDDFAARGYVVITA